MEITKSTIYNKNPLDDSLSCRKAAIFDIQTQLLSETYSLVTSTQTMTTTEYGENYEQKAEIILSGLLKIDIVYEEYDGAKYFMEAKVLIDTSESRRQIEQILKNKELNESLTKSLKDRDSLKTELNKLVAVGIDDDYSQQRYISLLDLIASKNMSFGEQTKISNQQIKSNLDENQFSYDEYVKQSRTVKVLATNEIIVEIMSPKFAKYDWGKYLMFNIMVANIGNKQILFSPDEITWIYKKSVYDSNTGKAENKAIAQKVISNDDYQKRLAQYKRRNEIWTSIAIGLNAAAIGANAGMSGEKINSSDLLSLHLQSEKLDRFSENMSKQMDKDASEYSQRNTIFANGGYYSYFLIPFSKKTSVESVIVPVNGKNFNFDFNGKNNFVK